MDRYGVGGGSSGEAGELDGEASDRVEMGGGEATQDEGGVMPVDGGEPKIA